MARKKRYRMMKVTEPLFEEISRVKKINQLPSYSEAQRIMADFFKQERGKKKIKKKIIREIEF